MMFDERAPAFEILLTCLRDSLPLGHRNSLRYGVPRAKPWSSVWTDKGTFPCFKQENSGRFPLFPRP